MSESKLVFAKELKQETTKNGKPYKSILDQDNEKWPLWNPVEIIVGRAYLIDFHVNEAGFKDIDKITPVVNIFQQKALHDVANKNDYVRNLSIALTQTIQVFAIGGKMPTESELFASAWSIYNWIDTKASSLMPKEETK